MPRIFKNMQTKTIYARTPKNGVMLLADGEWVQAGEYPQTGNSELKRESFPTFYARLGEVIKV